MNVALRRPMSVDEFLAWEERQALRYEFDGYQPRAMTGGTVAHSAIQSNLLAALGTRLRGQPCRPHGSHLKIRLDGRVRYPDAFVVCTPVAANATWVEDPVVIFEILSPGTMHEDLVVKNAEYEAAASVQRYVVLEQTHRGALVLSRRSGQWAADSIAGADAILQLPEIGIEIPLSELYADVDVAEEETVVQPP